MEIERKYLIKALPEGILTGCPCRSIEQAYLCTEPVVRIRKEDDSYYLTYKGKGLLAREEYNLPIKAYPHLTIELDIFEGAYEGLMLAEVEFPAKEEALTFTPPDWFGEDVTFSGEYQNSRLSQGKR